MLSFLNPHTILIIQHIEKWINYIHNSEYLNFYLNPLKFKITKKSKQNSKALNLKI